jgi:hypothetical protein
MNTQRSMRPALWLVLVAALLLAGVALWMPKPDAPAAVVHAVVPTSPASAIAAQQAYPHPVLGDLKIEAAGADPFERPPRALPAAGAAPVLPVPQPSPAVAAASTDVQPAAPAVSHRYYGRVKGPTGDELTMLARGDSPVLITLGTTLDDGYVVEAIGPETIRLVYPATATAVDLPIPPPASARQTR